MKMLQKSEHFKSKTMIESKLCIERSKRQGHQNKENYENYTCHWMEKKKRNKMSKF